MKSLRILFVALAVAVCLAPAAVLAEKGGKHEKEREPGSKGRPERVEPRHDGRLPAPPKDDRMRVEFRFGEQERFAVRDYYGAQARGGKCPPGLAKKRNGCMPPGLAKQWRIGYPLPRDVRYYDAPGDIVLRFGMPPEGHRYVRVAADILLIAVGTGMVVDALEDLNRM